MHCNSGSRIEALGYADYVLNYGIHYFSFDFSGSGNSDGEYISLGVRETDDLGSVIKYIREKLGISQIVLWVGAWVRSLHCDMLQMIKRSRGL